MSLNKFVASKVHILYHHHYFLKKLRMNIWPPLLAEWLRLLPSERVKGGGAHGDADDLDAERKDLNKRREEWRAVRVKGKKFEAFERGFTYSERLQEAEWSLPLCVCKAILGILHN